jgi:hypothetical protein
MVRVAMGQDDQINLLRRNPISFHLMEEMGDMTGMTRIDENRYLTTDQIGVAIVFVRILPQVGIEVFFDLHPLSFLPN